MNTDPVFLKCCVAVEDAYQSLGHSLGWRFLTSPSATFTKSQRIILLTLNPAGAQDYPDHPRRSSELGSAYLVEEWDGRPAGKAKLQKQIRLMFGQIADRIGVHSGDDLLNTSMSAHYIPFRSPDFASLHEQARTLAFAQVLWSDILSYLNPRIIITLSKDAFHAVLEIEKVLHSELPPIDALLIGWGQYTANVARFGDGQVICWLPHLSRFSIFGREKSEDNVRKIMDRLTDGF